MKKILLTFVTLIMSSAVLADERSLYNFSWLDNDKEIYVLQNRKFRKAESFYVGGTVGYNLSQDFLDAYGGSVRAGYFFKENWGIEALYSRSESTESDTAKGVKAQGAFPFYRDIKSIMGAMIMWSPFYSKINTFNQIFYYDWMFGLGVASVNTEDNRNLFNSTLPASSQRSLETENTLGALWNIGLRFYINTNWSLRLDVTGVTYKADRVKGDVSASPQMSSDYFTDYDLGLGLNYAF